MRLCRLLAMLAFGLGGAVAAHAQLGVYGMYSVTQYTGVQCLALAPATCSNGTAGRPVATSASGSVLGAPNTGTANPTGASGGLYYDFKTYGPVRLGVDFRGGANHANKSASISGGGDDIAGGSYFLAGIRGSLHVPISFIRPYAQLSVGYTHSDVTEPSNAQSPGNSGVPPRYFDSFLQYEGFIGADLHVLPVVDLRVLELGIGNMNRIGNGSSTDGSSSVGVRSLGAGVVFHLP